MKAKLLRNRSCYSCSTPYGVGLFVDVYEISNMSYTRLAWESYNLKAFQCAVYRSEKEDIIPVPWCKCSSSCHEQLWRTCAQYWFGAFQLVQSFWVIFRTSTKVVLGTDVPVLAGVESRRRRSTSMLSNRSDISDFVSQPPSRTDIVSAYARSARGQNRRVLAYKK